MRLNPAQPTETKVFWFFFSKKNRLPSLSRSRRSPRVSNLVLQATRTWRAALPAAGFLLLAAFRFALTNRAFRNSDDSGNFLAGVELAEGNWNLHGWVLAPDNYYPTDVLAQAVLRLLFGYHPVFMQVAEGLIWAGVALLGTRLACVGAPRRARPGIAALALALLAFNIFDHEFRDGFLSSIASHGFTILLVLATFALLAWQDGRPWRREAAGAAALFGLVLVGSFSDPIYIVTACLPVVAVCVLRLRGPGGSVRPAGRIAAVAGGVLLAHLLVREMGRAGGFETPPLFVMLAALQDLPHNIAFGLAAMVRLLGAEFFGRPVDSRLVGGPAIYLLRLPLALAVGIALLDQGWQVYRRVCAWPDAARAAPDTDLGHMLWFSAAFCFASATMTAVIVDDYCARFFYPAAVAGSILAARLFGRMALPSLYGAGCLAASVLVGVLALPPGWPGRYIAVPQVGQLIATLRAHGLSRGYSGYWEGTIVTALSGRQITSLPLIESDGPHVEPIRWFDNMDWFRTAARDWHGRVFFIVARDPSRLELSEATVTRQFGRPAERIEVGQFVVDVMNVPEEGLRGLAP